MFNEHYDEDLPDDQRIGWDQARKYTLAFMPESDGTFLGQVVELPTVTARGETIEECRELLFELCLHAVESRIHEFVVCPAALRDQPGYIDRIRSGVSILDKTSQSPVPARQTREATHGSIGT